MQGPTTAVLRAIGGMRVTVRVGVCQVALHEKVDEVLGELAHAGHQAPEQDQG